MSSFCTQLTSIYQTDVETAEEFPETFKAFMDWIGAESSVLVSWGAYDLKQIKQDCQFHGIENPEIFQQHFNLKKAFSEVRNIRPCGMKRALNILGIELLGTHHRGIDDARNIAKIFQSIASTIIPKYSILS